MVGGAVPPGFVTENESARHCPDVVTPTPDAAGMTMFPFNRWAVVTVKVEGPVIVKASKSSRSCN